MSLADELLADLEDGEEDVDDLEGEDDDEQIDEVMEATPIIGAYDRVNDVAKLAQSTIYKDLISQLHQMMELPEIPEFTVPLESDPQYELVLAIDIDQEVNVIYKFIKDKYAKRFPELETFVQMPMDFVRTVKLLGNDIDTKGQNKELLGLVLPPAACIVVSVTASTTQGNKLEDDELQIILEACELAEELDKERFSIHKFVEQRMTLIAPNLCRILGSGTAAMIVSQAGGLGPLSKQPACNVLVLGKQKKTLAGFSTAAVNPHSGFIYYHPIVQNLPSELRKKAARVIAAKSTLAARVDSLHQSPDGSIGETLAGQVKEKIDKMLEPPSVKTQKSLPKPLDKASKKRGGKRARKAKERMGMTDLRKKANRMNFGELQEDIMQDNIGFTLGQVKSESLAGGGRIRASVVDNKTRIKMSQKLQRQLERRQHGGMTSLKSKASGTMSSISITPIQGIEVISMTPLDVTKSSGSSTNSSYFDSTSNFMKVKTPMPNSVDMRKIVNQSRVYGLQQREIYGKPFISQAFLNFSYPLGSLRTARFEHGQLKYTKITDHYDNCQVILFDVTPRYMVERMIFPSFSALQSFTIYCGFNADSSVFFGVCGATRSSSSKYAKSAAYLHFGYLRHKLCVTMRLVKLFSDSRKIATHNVRTEDDLVILNYGCSNVFIFGLYDYYPSDLRDSKIFRLSKKTDSVLNEESNSFNYTGNRLKIRNFRATAAMGHCIWEFAEVVKHDTLNEENDSSNVLYFTFTHIDLESIYKDVCTNSFNRQINSTYRYKTKILDIVHDIMYICVYGIFPTTGPHMRGGSYGTFDAFTILFHWHLTNNNELCANSAETTNPSNSWCGQALSLEVDEVLFHEKSKYQDVLVFKSKSHGNVLVLDDVIQLTEFDEFAYHEMLAHLPLFAHARPESVLIIGGGDGGIAREVLKHQTVKKVVLCEIDEMVVRVSKQFLPTVAGELENERLELVIVDAFEYLKHHSNQFDVIITDLSDPQGPAEELYGFQFYSLLHDALKCNGIVAAQGECPWIDLPFVSKLYKTCVSIFPQAHYAISSVPTYTTGTMGYLICGLDKNTDIRAPKSDNELKLMKLKFYNFDLHRAAFALPNFIKKELEDS
ncbi:Pre-mRNA-processing factor 31 [Aphelenchoides besseyi]|nr:Pre-mRNA-processing factor 31 [Aphelenchoides besseyi]